MFKSLLMIVLLIPAANKDITYWWRTTGGAVVGTHHSRQCSLLLYNDMKAVITTWDRSDQSSIRLEDNSWNLVGGSMPLVLKINGMQVLSGTASGNGKYITMSLSAPIEQLLAHASMIEASYIDTSGVHHFSFAIDQTKMPLLLNAVDRCRHVP